MSPEYIIFSVAVAFGVVAFLVTIYLVYRRGIAIRLGWVVVGCVVPPTVAAFVLGKEGISPVTAAVAVAIVVPIIIALVLLMVRQIIAPARQMAATAEQIAARDLAELSRVAAALAVGERVEPMNAHTQPLAATTNWATWRGHSTA